MSSSNCNNNNNAWLLSVTSITWLNLFGTFPATFALFFLLFNFFKLLVQARLKTVTAHVLKSIRWRVRQGRKGSIRWWKWHSRSFPGMMTTILQTTQQCNYPKNTQRKGDKQKELVHLKVGLRELDQILATFHQLNDVHLKEKGNTGNKQTISLYHWMVKSRGHCF